MDAAGIFPMGVDVVVRVHDVKRLHELDRTLLSLYCQSFKPVHAIIVMQNFDDAGVKAVKSVVDKYDWAGFGQPVPSLHNAKVAAGDQRTVLLNEGIGQVRHRFLAFLDSDDYMYEDAYGYLIENALSSGSAVTFGNIAIKDVISSQDFVYNCSTRRNMFQGRGLADLMKDNFCPIHSYVIDREKVANNYLYFDPQLTRLEDYDFLLRICADHKCNFATREKYIGVYNWHLDGKNSITVHRASNDEKAAANIKAWTQARELIARRKDAIRTRLAARGKL